MIRSCLLVAARGQHQKRLQQQQLLLLLAPGQQCTQNPLINSSIQQVRHSSSNTRPDVPIQLPSVCIWGANTGVGKTLISAGLVAAAVRNKVGQNAVVELYAQIS